MPVPRDARFSGLLRPALLVLGTILLVFVPYELIERTWLSEMDAGVLYALHVLRGVGTAVLVAVLVGWYLVRRGTSLFPPEETSAVPPRAGTSGTPEALTFPEPLADKESRLVHDARWLIQMRWIVVLMATLAILTTVKIMKVLDGDLFVPLMATTVCLALANLVIHTLVNRGVRTRLVIEAQICTDLLILTVLLHFSGGIENPLVLGYLFYIIVNGILLAPRECYLAAGAGSVMFSVMVLVEWGGLVEHYTLTIFPHGEKSEPHAAHDLLYVLSLIALQWVVLFLAAYLVTAIARRLKARERDALAMSRLALAERQRLERVVQATGTGLLVLDKSLEVVWCNEQLREWMGLPQEITGLAAQRLREWTGGEMGPAARCLKEGSTQVSERILSGSLGDQKSGERFLQITTAPLFGEDGKVFQVVELAQDITEQKRAQAKLMLAGKMAAVGELAGNVAHEVNNPVAIISAKARLLLSDHSDGMSEKVASDLRKMVSLADRLGRMTQGLLNYCRPSPAVRARMDIRMPLKNALSLVEDLARQADIRVVEELDSPVYACANGNEMEQVFLNLLVNAVDAMPKGGELAVSAHMLNGKHEAGKADEQPRVAVAVSDTGTGIPLEIREKIFEPFFTTKEEERGTGLGLSICLGLVRSHGGEIEVDSEPGRGTRFTVTLPAAAEDKIDG